MSPQDELRLFCAVLYYPSAFSERIPRVVTLFVSYFIFISHYFYFFYSSQGDDQNGLIRALFGSPVGNPAYALAETLVKFWLVVSH